MNKNAEEVNAERRLDNGGPSIGGLSIKLCFGYEIRIIERTKNCEKDTVVPHGIWHALFEETTAGNTRFQHFINFKFECR